MEINIIFLGTSKVTWGIFPNELSFWLNVFSVKLIGNEF